MEHFPVLITIHFPSTLNDGKQKNKSLLKNLAIKNEYIKNKQVSVAGRNKLSPNIKDKKVETIKKTYHKPEKTIMKNIKLK